MKKTGLMLAGALAMTMVGAAAANAAVNTYEISGVGSGTLGSSSFTDAAFTLKMVGDTDNLGTIETGVTAIDPLISSTFEIAGEAAASLSFPTRFGLNTDYNVFFASNSGTDGADFLDVSVSGADASAFTYSSPYAAVGSLDYDEVSGLATSQGDLTLNTSGPLTVTELPAVSAAPEPSTWLLMFAGIGGIGLMLRRAKKTMGFRFKDAFAA